MRTLFRYTWPGVGAIIGMSLLLMLLIAISAGCAARKTDLPTHPPLPRADDFIAGGETPWALQWERAGAPCDHDHIWNIPVHFCENPSAAGEFAAYAHCGGEILGEARFVRRPPARKKFQREDFERMVIIALRPDGSRVEGLPGWLPRPEVFKNGGGEEAEVLLIRLKLKTAAGWVPSRDIKNPADCFEPDKF